MNTIQWQPKATKQLYKLPIDAQRAVGAGVKTLMAWPDVPGVKKLVNRNDYRLRVGRYRVLFTVSPKGEAIIIQIEEVKKRDEHTY